MSRQTVFTERVEIPGGTELRASLWRDDNGNGDALVLTTAFKGDLVRFTHRSSGQVAVPGEHLDDVVGALTRLQKARGRSRE